MRRMVRGGLSALALGALVAVAAVPPGAVAAQTVRQTQWHLDSLRIAEAHRLSTGEGVVVAVIDSGVQADHPDLRGRVLDGHAVGGDTDRGRVDRHNHGTGVAGLIAARGGGRNRALGVAPDARILPVRVHTGSFGGGNPAEGIRYAVDNGAEVINISLGASRVLDVVQEAVRYAQSRDVVVVASAGNLADGGDGVNSPAVIPGVIAVSAVDRDGEFWSGGVRGPEIALAAPGVEIATISSRTSDGKVGGHFVVPGGTSAAAPLVSGAAALVRARFPDLSAADVVNRLLVTADDAGPDGRDDEYGFGRLNLVRALTEEVPPVAANPLGEVPPPAAEAEADETWADLFWDTPLPVLLLAGVALLVGIVTLVLIVFLVRRRVRRGNRANYV